MSRTRLLVSLVAATSVAACGGQDQVVQPVVPTFSPLTGDIPIPNDLLFNGSFDGTLNIPNDDDLDAFNALNSQDGWSTLAPISLSFNGELDPDTLLSGVRLFEVATVDDLQPGQPVAAITSALTPGIDYLPAPTPDGKGVAILPLRPLKADQPHMVLITNDTLSADGLPVSRSALYGILASDQPVEDPSQLALQVLIQSMLSAGEDSGVDPDSVVMSFTFRTQSVGQALEAVAFFAAGDGAESAALGSALSLNPALLYAPDDATGDVLPNNDPANAASVGNFSAVLNDTAAAIDLWQGELTIPTYLDVPADFAPQDTTILGTRWESRFAFGDPNEPDRNPTRLNPFPKTKGSVTIPVLVTTPVGAPPADGWPVVITQHGINSSRAFILGAPAGLNLVDSTQCIAGKLAAQGFACVSIDQPLHGLDLSTGSAGQALNDLFVDWRTTDANGPVRERTFGIDLLNNGTSAPGPDGQPDPTGKHYINLASLRTSRDNLRQAVADLLWLRSVIGDIDLDGGGPDLDGTDVSFLGQSLGAMVGVPYLRYSEIANGVAAGTGSLIEFTHSAAVLSVPGGGIAELLRNSVSFGPQVTAGVAAGAGLDPADPAFAGVLAQFLFAAQSGVDSVDPLNHAAGLAATTVPVQLHEVIGDGLTNLPDQVVPNSVPIPGTPFSLPAGTEPLITALGLPSVTTDLIGDASGAIRFVEGSHGSLATPADSLAAFDDMNALAGEFISTAGTSATITGKTTVSTE